MRYRTELQNRRLHTLLNQTGLMEEKAGLVELYTEGRTQSSRELYQHEAEKLNNYLAILPGAAKASQEVENQKIAHNKTERMQKKIYAICFTIGWFQGSSREDWKMNLATLDAFLLKRGYLKKPLKEFTSKELPRLVSQFEQLQVNQEKNSAGKAISGLLEELGIDVQQRKNN